MYTPFYDIKAEYVYIYKKNNNNNNIMCSYKN